MIDQPLAHTVLVHDAGVDAHDPGPHPECPERVRHALEVLTAPPDGLKVMRATPAAREDLLRVHSAEHVDRVEAVVAAGGGAIDADTIATPATWNAALLAAGAGPEAVRAVAAHTTIHPFCLIRPPGHHATRDRAMGFCFFNNIAVTAAYLRDVLHVERVLIVDFDVHHGNGTQDIFYACPQVHVLSSHRSPFYPHTGAAEETGVGDGVGATTNLPLSAGTPVATQMGDLEGAVRRVADAVEPEWILASAGFDAYHADPVGSLGWDESNYHAIGEMLGDVAREYAGGRLVSLLEGGYAVDALPTLIRAYAAGVTRG